MHPLQIEWMHLVHSKMINRGVILRRKFFLKRTEKPDTHIPAQPEKKVWMQNPTRRILLRDQNFLWQAVLVIGGTGLWI